MTARSITRTTSTRQLTAAATSRARHRLDRQTARNPLRRVRTDCHGWVRDASAAVGDWVWCTSCADWRRVTELAE